MAGQTQWAQLIHRKGKCQETTELYQFFRIVVSWSMGKINYNYLENKMIRKIYRH